jgi:hypothetical protein
MKIGSQSTPINIGEYLVKCPACESDHWADVMVVSNYWYFYFIPMFPLDKQANVICKTCGLKRYGSVFNSKLISNYEEVKHLYRHPWFTYLGVGMILFFFLLFLFFVFLLPVL